MLNEVFDAKFRLNIMNVLFRILNQDWRPLEIARWIEFFIEIWPSMPKSIWRMMVTLMTLIGATIRIFVQNFENIEFFVNLRMSAKDLNRNYDMNFGFIILNKIWNSWWIQYWPFLILIGTIIMKFVHSFEFYINTKMIMGDPNDPRWY